MKKKHVIETEFWMGDTVYRRTDIDNEPGLVCEVLIGPDESCLYRCVFGKDPQSSFYEMELSAEPSYDTRTFDEA